MDGVSEQFNGAGRNSNDPSAGSATTFKEKPQQPGLSSLGMKPTPPAPGESQSKEEDDDDKKKTPRLGH